MINKVNWNRTGKVALKILIAIAFVVSVGFADSRQHRMLCDGLKISIKDTLELSFVEPDDVRIIVHNKIGDPVGKKLSSINISMLEKIIDNNPFVSDAEVFSSIDGKLNIEVLQRRPVVRVVNFNQESFYIDDQGSFMPLSDKFTARVPVANGYIFDRESDQRVKARSSANVTVPDTGRNVIGDIFEVAHFVNQNEFWTSQIEQIYVNGNGDLELIPRVGMHTIIFGDAKDITGKFDRLYLFYTKGLSKTGWDKYKTINLKFKDQVVCTKR
jgi:cell division protein FtsQ